MLLRITVLQHKGSAPPAALAYMFDERGGTIGREECNLTLPDSTRVLSRVQAQIVFADGLFSLLDQGGNPSLVNSLRVGKGKSRILYDGDIIELCDYKLRVKTIGIPDPVTKPAMRANDPLNFDPLNIEELVPPILLDPDELAQPAEPSLTPNCIAQSRIDSATTEDEELDISFEHDVAFDDDATLGIDYPLDMEDGKNDAPDSSQQVTVQNTLAQAPLRNAEHAAMLAALCKGLGIASPECTTSMLPQHVGIVMRRAMLHALEEVLVGFTPADLEKRLADRELLNFPPPSDRKTKLWELFEQCHAEISHDAEDKFLNLFGQAFLKACETQINRLHQHN